MRLLRERGEALVEDENRVALESGSPSPAALTARMTAIRATELHERSSLDGTGVESEAPVLALRHHDGLALTAAERQALRAVQEHLESIRSLVVCAVWPATDASDRADIDRRVRERVAVIDALADRTQFLGLRLLAGECPMVGIQTRTAGPEFVVLGLVDATPRALGIAELDVTSPMAARSALCALECALDLIESAQRVIAADVRALLG